MAEKIPAVALAIILQSWSAVLHLVSAWWTERLLARQADHWLVQLAQVLDLRPLEQACAPYHQGQGKGSAVTHPVPRLVRALLLKYLLDLSYRQTEEQLACNLLYKWFVGYGLFADPPDHTTLHRFELWVLKHQPHFFFQDTLRQIDARFPQEPQQKQLVDTFAMLARGAKTSLITLLRRLCSKLLADLQRLDPQRHQELLAHLDLEALFGKEKEKITPALTTAEREQRLQLIVRQVWRLYHWLSHSLDQQPLLPADQQDPLRQWLSYLDKIMADEVSLSPLEPDQAPAQMTVKERPSGKKGNYRIASYNDLEATYRKHSNDEAATLGYNAAVLTSATYIRQTEVVTGSTPDYEPLPTMLERQHQQQGFFPDKVIGDMIFGCGKCRAQVHHCSEGQTQLVALLMPYDKRSDLFSPSDFTLSDDGRSLTCPNGQTTTKRYPSQSRGGYDFAFTPPMCRGCSSFHDCREAGANPNSRRKVFVSFYRAHVDAALEYNRSAPFKIEIKQRLHVERLIYNLTNLHGARRCRAVGLAKANFQLRMAATAFNLRQFVRQLARCRAPAPSTGEACV